MNAAKTREVAASLRDQILDVRLGTITRAEWARIYDATIRKGLVMPTDLATFRAQLTP